MHSNFTLTPLINLMLVGGNESKKHKLKGAFNMVIKLNEKQVHELGEEIFEMLRMATVEEWNENEELVPVYHPKLAKPVAILFSHISDNEDENVFITVDEDLNIKVELYEGEELIRSATEEEVKEIGLYSGWDLKY